MLPSRAVAGPAPGVPAGSAVTMQPLVYGYIRLGPADDPAAGECLAHELAAHAEREGLTLADIFVDHCETGAAERLGRSAFMAMVQSLRRPGVYGVLVPSLSHFSRFPGVHEAMRTLIELETGARVLVLNHPPEDAHDTPGRATPAAGHDLDAAP